MIDSMTSSPFSALTLPITDSPTENKEKVMALSRRKYGVDITQVDERIKRWTERQFSLGLAKAEEMREQGETLGQTSAATIVQNESQAPNNNP